MKEKMKNTIRRVLSVFAAIAMVLGVMGTNVTPVMAADLGELTTGTEGAAKTITVTSPDNVPANTVVKYLVYKVFDASPEESGVAVNYTLPSTNAVGLPIESGNEKIDKDDAGNIHYYTRNSESNAWTINTTTTELSAGMTKAIGNAISNGNVAAIGTITVEGPNAKKTVSVPDYGYYYITSTTGTAVAINTTHPSAKIKDKNIVPSVDKEEDNPTNYIEDTVNYTVTLNLYAGSKAVVFHDHLSKGLTLNANTEPVVKEGEKTLTKNTEYTLDKFQADATANGSTTEDNITIMFSESYLNDITGTASNPTIVTISYSATVNDQAKINENNSAHIEYGNNAKYETTPKKTIYESTFGFKVNKVDSQSTPQPLTGAKFVLGTTYSNVNLDEDTVDDNAVTLGLIKFKDGIKNLSGGQYIQSSGNDSTFTFNGLDANDTNTDGTKGTTYYLYEVTAPSGYQKLTEPIDVKITPTMSANDNTQVESYTVEWKLHSATTWNTAEGNDLTTLRSFNVINTKGTLLPSTGGIGTTIFYVIGGVVVAGAIVLLIARRKRNA